jgi:hypothetical protein
MGVSHAWERRGISGFQVVDKKKKKMKKRKKEGGSHKRKKRVGKKKRDELYEKCFV